MKERDYKIKNDKLFKYELARLFNIYNIINKNKLPKGQRMVIETLIKINSFVFHKKYYTHQNQYSYLLHYLEYKGGEEFLDTKEGKEIIEIFFYFADIYKIEDK